MTLSKYKQAVVKAIVDKESIGVPNYTPQVQQAVGQKIQYDPTFDVSTQPIEDVKPFTLVTPLREQQPVRNDYMSDFSQPQQPTPQPVAPVQNDYMQDKPVANREQPSGMIDTVDEAKYLFDINVNKLFTLPNKIPQIIGNIGLMLTNSSKRNIKAIQDFAPDNLKDNTKFVEDMNDRLYGVDKAQKFWGDIIQYEVVKDKSQEIIKKYDGKVDDFTKFTGDVSGAVIDMLPQTAIAYFSGGANAMAYVFADSSSQATKSALQLGADAEQAQTYGVIMGAIEVGTEMIVGGWAGVPKGKFTGIFKTGLSKPLQDAALKMSKTELGKKAITMAFEYLGEGAEEYLSEVLGNYANAIIGEDVQSLADIQEEALYSGLIGTFTSMVSDLGRVGLVKTAEKVSQAEMERFESMPKEEQIAYAQKVLDKSKTELVFSDNFQGQEVKGAGMFTNVNGKNFVVLPTSMQDGGENILSVSLMHEYTHTLEQSGQYQKFSENILNHLDNSGLLDVMRQTKQELYKNENLTPEDIDSEIVATFVQDNMFKRVVNVDGKFESYTDILSFKKFLKDLDYKDLNILKKGLLGFLRSHNEGTLRTEYDTLIEQYQDATKSKDLVKADAISKQLIQLTQQMDQNNPKITKALEFSFNELVNDVEMNEKRTVKEDKTTSKKQMLKEKDTVKTNTIFKNAPKELFDIVKGIRLELTQESLGYSKEFIKYFNDNKKQYGWKKFTNDDLNQLWIDVKTEQNKKLVHEITDDESAKIIRSKIVPSHFHGWFIEANSGFKPKIMSFILNNPDVFNATLNNFWRNYNYEQEFKNGKQLTFDEFLNTEVELYRGWRNQDSRSKMIEDDLFISFSIDKKIAEKFSKQVGYIETLNIKPIDTYGSINRIAEGEVMIPKFMLKDDKKLEDFGEKIGGAKKDLFKEGRITLDSVANMNEAEMKTLITKDKVFGKIDYKKLVEDGMPDGVAYFIKTIKDGLYTSPNYSEKKTTEENTKQYIEEMNSIRAFVDTIKTKEDVFNAFNNFFVKNGYYDPNGLQYYRWTQKMKDSSAISYEAAAAMRDIKTEYDYNALVRKANKSKGYDVIFVQGKNKYFITKGHYIIGDGYATEAEAIEAAKNQNKSTTDNGKIKITPPQLERVERVGYDYRQSKDVEGQNYLDEFKFRGGEFGNWENANDRQTSLNYGYDALNDLANTLGIAPESISLNGDLAIAFGARGSGKALAHYEPLRRVINLTKMKGAGSLGHEWFHALDHYLSKIAGVQGADTKLLSEYFSSINDLNESSMKYNKMEKFPQATARAFVGLIETMKYQSVPLTVEAQLANIEKQNARYRRNIESWVDKYKDYPGAKKQIDAIMNGDMNAVEKLNKIVKDKNGRMMPKENRDQILLNIRMLRIDTSNVVESKKRADTKYYEDAKFMDDNTSGGKLGGYWSSSEELLARAFSTYLTDKLGIRSDYLVSGASNSLYPDKVNPYPQGELRTEINEQFDQLFKALKEDGLLKTNDKPVNIKTDKVDIISDEKGVSAELPVTKATLNDIKADDNALKPVVEPVKEPTPVVSPKVEPKPVEVVKPTTKPTMTADKVLKQAEDQFVKTVSARIKKMPDTRPVLKKVHWDVATKKLIWTDSFMAIRLNRDIQSLEHTTTKDQYPQMDKLYPTQFTDTKGVNMEKLTQIVDAPETIPGLWEDLIEAEIVDLKDLKPEERALFDDEWQRTTGFPKPTLSEKAIATLKRKIIVNSLNDNDKGKMVIVQLGDMQANGRMIKEILDIIGNPGQIQIVGQYKPFYVKSEIGDGLMLPMRTYTETKKNTAMADIRRKYFDITTEPYKEKGQPVAPKPTGVITETLKVGEPAKPVQETKVEPVKAPVVEQKQVGEPVAKDVIKVDKNTDFTDKKFFTDAWGSVVLDGDGTAMVSWNHPYAQKQFGDRSEGGIFKMLQKGFAIMSQSSIHIGLKMPTDEQFEFIKNYFEKTAKNSEIMLVMEELKTDTTKFFGYDVKALGIDKVMEQMKNDVRSMIDKPVVKEVAKIEQPVEPVVEEVAKVEQPEPKTRKEAQLNIINQFNPATKDNIHTWIRSVDDIKTYEEIMDTFEEIDPDFTQDMADEALESGQIKVYSSYPIEQGVFVSPSKMEAQSYAGTSRVYSKVVGINDVAWIAEDQGQYAQTDFVEPQKVEQAPEITPEPILEPTQAIEPIVEQEPVVEQKPVVEQPQALQGEPSEEKTRTRSVPITTANAGVLTQEQESQLVSEIKSGKFEYTPFKDKTAMAYAEGKVSTNPDGAYQDFKSAYENNRVMNKNDIAVAERLIKHFADTKNNAKVEELIGMVAEIGTQLGQQVQALSLIKKMSPAGQTMVLEKTIERIEESYRGTKLEQKGGEVMPEVQTPQIEAKQAVGDFNVEKDKVDQMTPETVGEVQTSLNKIAKKHKVDPKAVELDQALVKSLAEQKTPEDAQKVVEDIKKDAKKKLNGVIKSLNKLKKTYEGKKIDLSIDPELKDRLLQAKSQKEIDEIVELIKVDVAKRLPATLGDKLNAWRYLSMLGNPKTHIRNIISNATFGNVAKVKDKIAYAIEQGFIKPEDRTKAVKITKGVKNYATELFNDRVEEITASGKYDMVRDIEGRKRIFDNDAGEKLRLKNFELLENADIRSMKKAFVSVLGQYMTARNLDPKTITDAQLESAITYASEQAKVRTFRQFSATANLLNRIEKTNTFTKVLIGSLVPFKKTPINILKTGFEYSPAGLLVNMTYGLAQVRKGVENGGWTTTQFVDKISAGLTGTGIAALGAMLSAMGVLSVGDDDEKSKKETIFGSSLGQQRYSLNIGDYSVSLDWLAPAVMPLMIGAEIEKWWGQDKGGNLLDESAEALTNIFNPAFDLTMLQGVSDAFKSFESAGANQVGDILTTMLANYTTQFVPTILSQAAKTLDPNIRSTYAGSGISGTIETTFNKIKNKIPFASMTNNPVINVKGQEVTQSGEIWLRAVQNFLNPANIKQDITDKTDQEIMRVFNKTDDTSVIPALAPSSFTYNGVKIDLQDDGKTLYATTMGNVSYNVLDEVFKNQLYKSIGSDDLKADIIKDSLSYASSVAKSKLMESQGKVYVNTTLQKMSEAETNGVSLAEYLIMDSKLNTIDSTEDFTRKEQFISDLVRQGYTDDEIYRYLVYVGDYTYTKEDQKYIDILRNVE